MKQPPAPRAPRIDLRQVSSEALHRELRARSCCCDCRRQNSQRWTAAGPNRVRCYGCSTERHEGSDVVPAAGARG